MKGFNTSTDYNKLWDLINEGYCIPAWILYSDEYKEPIYDIVEVKMRGSYYMIGTRGICYEGIFDGKEGFIESCEGNQLRYITPVKNLKKQNESP